MADSITIVGRVGSDPERVSTRDGKPLTSFSLATNDRFRGEDGQWRDGETSWYAVSVYGRLAENAAASLKRGERVIVHGAVRMHKWATKNGETRVEAQLRAIAVGHDLAFGTTAFSGKQTVAAQPTVEQADQVIDRSDEWATPVVAAGPVDGPAADGFVPVGADAEPSWHTLV